MSLSLPLWAGNLFGRQVYQLPGLFAYAKHIIKVDGKAGLFKGLGPRLCAGTIGTVVHSRVVQKCQEQGTPQLLGEQKAAEGSLQHVVNETTKEMIARSCATIVTHPFHGLLGWLACLFSDYPLLLCCCCLPAVGPTVRGNRFRYADRHIRGKIVL